MFMEIGPSDGADPKDALLLHDRFSALFAGETGEDERCSPDASDRTRLVDESPDLRVEFGENPDR
ncbi:hypothetical protein [Frankia sp. EAN1pec]|uniref:hypothetical protein n=1 Tax=Parafrankia sp. (strain EAN1pec) TaxID=298653 RepID=UPI0002EBDECE